MSIEVELGPNCSIRGVSHEALDDVWPQVAPLIAKALSYSRGELNVDDVLHLLLEQLMQLWVANDNTGRVEMCVVTQIINYPRKRFLRIVVLAGSQSYRWERGWELIAAWARQLGCDGVESFARPGIARLYKKLGFRSYYSMVGLDFQPLNIH
jgi:hypothetical protein